MIDKPDKATLALTRVEMWRMNLLNDIMDIITVVLRKEIIARLVRRLIT